jgi:hypothetical protein
MSLGVELRVQVAAEADVGVICDSAHRDIGAVADEAGGVIDRQ